MNRHRSPTSGNLDAEILEFWGGLLNSGIRENFSRGIRNPELWNPIIQLKESGIPQEEISLPFVTVKRKEK